MMRNKWMPEDADDETQLLRASARGRVLFTFNIGDFSKLAVLFPEHAGIILANQSSWQLSTLIHALDKLLKHTTAKEWAGQVRWLNEWRD